MEAVDTKRKKEFHKKTTCHMSFQDIARKEMAKQNRRAVCIGMKRRRRYMKENAEKMREETKVKQYSESIKNRNIQHKNKRYVIIIS